MRRREFITSLGALTAWPLTARAQQSERVRHIGVLMAFSENDPEAQSWAKGFRQELGKLGWTEGHNVHIDTRWATADVESLQRLAEELVALQPDFVLTGSTPATASMHRQTSTIPILFVMVGDPVGSGFVATSRPDADQFRSGHQSQDCKGAGSRRAFNPPAARRRVDRIAMPHDSAFGPKRTSLVAPHMSAFRGKADMPFCTAHVCFLTRSGPSLSLNSNFMRSR